MVILLCVRLVLIQFRALLKFGGKEQGVNEGMKKTDLMTGTLIVILISTYYEKKRLLEVVKVKMNLVIHNTFDVGVKYHSLACNIGQS